jgi:hypothetical protein
MMAIGRELEFMNIEPATAKLLWERLSRKVQPRMKATAMESVVTITKNIGMTHSSRSFSAALREVLYTSPAKEGTY